MTKITGFLLVLVLSASLLKSQDLEVLTLDQALALALQGNREIRNARLEIQKSENDVAISHTYLLPSFDLNVFEGQFLGQVKFEVPAGAWGVYPATGPIPATQTPITTPAHPFTIVQARASQALSQIHALKLGTHLREYQREEADERLKAQRLLVTNQVRKLCYGILETQSALVANESAMKTLREEDRVLAENVSRRITLRSEELDVKARVARVEYESASLQHDLATQKEQLNDLMGRDPRREYTLSALPDDSAAGPDLTASLNRALAERPEIREARLKIQEASAERDIKKSERIPEVRFNVEYLSPFRIAFLPENILSAGVSFKWDVFDWGRKKRELANKSIAVDQAGIALQSVQSQVAAEVEVLYRKVEDGQHLLETVRTAQSAAREKVRIAGERHAQDAALLKDLMEAQQSLAQADFQYQQAFTSYMRARADLDKASAAQ